MSQCHIETNFSSPPAARFFSPADCRFSHRLPRPSLPLRLLSPQLTLRAAPHRRRPSSPLRCRHFPIATYRLLLWYSACLSRHLRCCNRYISRGSSHFYPFWSHSPSLNIVQSKHQKPLTQLFRIFSLNYLTPEGSFVLSL